MDLITNTVLEIKKKKHLPAEVLSRQLALANSDHTILTDVSQVYPKDRNLLRHRLTIGCLAHKEGVSLHAFLQQRAWQLNPNVAVRICSEGFSYLSLTEMD